MGDRPWVQYTRWLGAGLLGLSVGLSWLAHAGEPSADPILRIETGAQHTASILRLGVDATGRWLVTAANDKTARVWQLPTGRLDRVLRWPLGPGPEGAILSTAISPDGKVVALGGGTGWYWDERFSIYLFDRASGRMLRRLEGLPGAVTELAFSRDGRWLAAGIGTQNGLRVWRTADWKLSFEDTEYGGTLFNMDFSEDGRLATTSSDGNIRLYQRTDPNWSRAAWGSVPDSIPYAIRFSPDGRKLAVTFSASRTVYILDGKDLKYLATVDDSGIENGEINTVAWSVNQHHLFGGGDWALGAHRALRIWPTAGKDGFKDVTGVATNTIMDLRALPDGSVAVGTSDPMWGIYNTVGTRLNVVHPAFADYRNLDRQKRFRLSTDGQRVSFGYNAWGPHQAVFDLDHLSLLQGYELGIGNLPPSAGTKGEPGGVQPPIQDLPGLQLAEDWRLSQTPRLTDGTHLKILDSDRANCLAMSADGQRLVLGTAFSLALFDRQGKRLEFQSAPEQVWAVNFSRDGRLVVAAYGDGTIRWHRASDLKELLALFPHADRKRWVLWTPSGYYATSPGGEDLIGWHVNRGKDQAADFFPASRFRDKFHRPDVAQKMLTTLDEKEALRLADAEAGRVRSTVPHIGDSLPPVVTLLSPAEGEAVSSPSVTLRYSVRAPLDAPMTGLTVRVNGQRLPDARDIVVDKPDGGEPIHEVRVPLEAAENLISLSAENRHNLSSAVQLRVYRKAAAPGAAAPKPKLYVLAVGVAEYDKVRPRLKYAAKDARDFAEVMKHQSGGLYREVEVKLVTDAQATKDEILDGLEWLQKQVTGRDVGMMFLAGHGVNDPTGNFYFLPVNADPDRLKRTGLVYTDIKNTLSALAGKAVFFVDACHSGNVLGEGRRGNTDLTAVVNELASTENGVVVFSSSTGRESSLENPNWGNGAFTKAVVEGLSGKAAETRSGRVTHAMLDFYVSERVKALTDGRQHPVKQNPDSVPDFPLAVVK
ncbi:MAG TPA: caspase family protein [Thiobacillaceae bacterium]|nr:caspase family protein [Thiobacillaceae bacterium]